MKTTLRGPQTAHSVGQSPARSGFTLIEILAVILIIGILATFVVPKVVSAIGLGKTTACRANLEAIKRGFLEYEAKYNKIPTGSGVSFFASLITREVWDASVKDSQTLTCPAVAYTALTPGQAGLPIEEWFAPSEKDAIDGGYSSYAGRDQQRHPLRNMRGKGNTALVADDNDPVGNHKTTTNVLWDDLTVRAIELVDLKDDGTLDPEDETIPVGPDSPVEGLQVLTLDK